MYSTFALVWASEVLQQLKVARQPIVARQDFGDNLLYEIGFVLLHLKSKSAAIFSARKAASVALTAIASIAEPVHTEPIF